MLAEINSNWHTLAIVCIGACCEFALEPLEFPFILSGVCSTSEANYCSNPFEVFLTFLDFTTLRISATLMHDDVCTIRIM